MNKLADSATLSTSSSSDRDPVHLLSNTGSFCPKTALISKVAVIALSLVIGVSLGASYGFPVGALAFTGVVGVGSITLLSFTFFLTDLASTEQEKLPSQSGTDAEYLTSIDKESSCFFTEKIPDFFTRYFVEEKQDSAAVDLTTQLQTDKDRSLFFKNGQPIEILKTIEEIEKVDSDLALKVVQLSSQGVHADKAKIIFFRYMTSAHFLTTQYPKAEEESLSDPILALGVNLLTDDCGRPHTIEAYDAYTITQVNDEGKEIAHYYIPAKMEINLQSGAALITWRGPTAVDDLGDIQGIMRCFS